MMTQQLELSVLSAPVAAIDRRSLSQAWYSALHLAHEPRKESAPRPQPTESPTAPNAPPQRERFIGAGTNRTVELRPRREQQAARRVESASDRRSVRSPLARKIEATFLNPGRPIARATFSIDGAAAKVHVCMQNVNGRLRLMAVCSPRVRDAVSRALEEARYALAARGIAVDARMGQ